MYVRTQFDTIVNLAEFGKIKIEWHERQSSGSVFHVISAVSEEKSRPIAVAGTSMLTSKSETLAQFPEDMAEKAKDAYLSLFEALNKGRTAFDIKHYTN